MKFGILFLLLGIVAILQAVLLRGVWWLMLWPSLSLILVGLGYVKLGPCVFGKQQSGSQAWYCLWCVLPYLLVNWFIWHIFRLTSREDFCNEVLPGLIIGRRPLAGEVPENVGLLVDLTAEFPERRSVREGRVYLAAPTLDAGIMQDDQYFSLLQQILDFPGVVYVHCAQGHGRTGTVAAGILLAKGKCETMDEAVQWLKKVRPKLILSRDQRAFLQRISVDQRFSIRTPSLTT